jgi:sporulation protein YlmC with PRC-barrel domain
MKSAELFACTVYDADGRPVGPVRDLHFHAVRDPVTGALVEYRLYALECGSGSAIGDRLGYDRDYMTGPAALKALFRRLKRASFLVEWADVTRIRRPRVDARRRREEFERG